jgi:hypothetical protein
MSNSIEMPDTYLDSVSSKFFANDEDVDGDCDGDCGSGGSDCDGDCSG